MKQPVTKRVVRNLQSLLDSCWNSETRGLEKDSVYLLEKRIRQYRKRYNSSFEYYSFMARLFKSYLNAEEPPRGDV